MSDTHKAVKSTGWNTATRVALCQELRGYGHYDHSAKIEYFWKRVTCDECKEWVPASTLKTQKRAARLRVKRIESLQHAVTDLHTVLDRTSERVESEK